ncbi:MAG: hypothetical protein F6J94_25465 [Moorea sp. SIO1F2]|uniref:hypothetical protein n=1 Tax=unclassified Moorena TaxID=2683338 RepID=UPI0013BC84D1|nr:MULTISPECIES: hypothetical protein [unclassified Moorena]NEN97963.1 hypothetical protein [Moorena sp. SIO3I7]NEO05986.1 hypothetical protein [Moorena sp. SIO3I8]NEO21073.1 hypothetical protein [Moorena sp. SIO4A5]NEP25895.1 hypothetical protein [Moorena sp. SIO3I6]NEQ61634.1 hypothetical protein [Moorena sp. SIO4A1]
MTNDSDLAIAYALALLSHYGFELRGYTVEELVNLWLENYPANWVRLAVIEALYQGRYKAISVEQILAVWLRRGQPIYRFNHEFERMVCRKFPQNLTAPVDSRSTTESLELSLQWVDNVAETSLGTSSDEITPEQGMLESKTLQAPPTGQQETSPPANTISSKIPEKSVKPRESFPKPLSKARASPSYNVDWSSYELNKKPIHQFHPPPDSSDVYLKLKAVVQHQDSGTVTATVVDKQVSDSASSALEDQEVESSSEVESPYQATVNLDQS